MHLALGFQCRIFDCGTNRTFSKTIYRGVPLIKYLLDRYWYGLAGDAYRFTRDGKNKVYDQAEYYNHIYERLFLFDNTKEKTALKTKLNYYKRFLNSTEVDIVGVSQSTDKDGNYDYFTNKLKNEY